MALCMGVIENSCLFFFQCKLPCVFTNQVAECSLGIMAYNNHPCPWGPLLELGGYIPSYHALSVTSQVTANVYFYFPYTPEPTHNPASVVCIVPCKRHKNDRLTK